MKTKPLLPLLLFLLSFLFLSCQREQKATQNTNSIQIKGSDTIVNLVQVWAERFVAENPDDYIGVTGGGSGTGFAALMNKTCDIAMASRKIEDSEIQEANRNGVFPFEFTVGFDGLAILVHKTNPIEQLTMEQLRDIFMGNVQNWKELGGADLKIVILSRESNSGTHLFFKEQVLRRGDAKAKEEFAPQALLMPSSKAILDEISQNPNAVGYVGMGFSNENVKTIKVASRGSLNFILPTAENVLTWAYPISRPLYLYTNGDPQNLVKRFIDYALSDKGQRIVIETYFVPIRKL